MPEHHAASTIIELDGAATIRNAASLHQRLAEALRPGGRVVVDCSAAVEVDVSLIQLLLSAQRSAAERGAALSLSAPATGVLRQVLLRGGFIAPEGMPAAAAEALWTTGADAS